MQYQNLFTQIQPVSKPHDGVPLKGPDNDERIIKPFLLHIAGRLGNAQIGPLYLGKVGIASAFCFIIAFTIMGWNMLVQVNYDPIQFVRQLFWLSLDPPSPEYGLKLAPLNKGGWWNIAGFFLTVSILLWWVRVYRRARALGMGTHIAWAFAAAIWLYLVLGFIRPLLMGSCPKGFPLASSLTWTGQRRFRFDTETCSTTRSICCRLLSCMDLHCYSRCTAQRFLR